MATNKYINYAMLLLAGFVVGVNFGFFVFGLAPLQDCERAVEERDYYINTHCSLGVDEDVYLQLLDQGLNDTIWIKKGGAFVETTSKVNISEWLN